MPPLKSTMQAMRPPAIIKIGNLKYFHVSRLPIHVVLRAPNELGIGNPSDLPVSRLPILDLTGALSPRSFAPRIEDYQQNRLDINNWFSSATENFPSEKNFPRREENSSGSNSWLQTHYWVSMSLLAGQTKPPRLLVSTQRQFICFSFKSLHVFPVASLR